MSSSQTNAWLRAQRKLDLVQVADSVGLKNYESLKKSELEVALDEFIAENSSRLANRSDLAPYFTSRSKALGSPVKKEKDSSKDESEKPLKIAKRRATKALEELTSESDERGSSTAITRTPARSLSQVAARIPLPATPADVANAFDRSTIAMRKRVTSIYQETGITEASNATRETLSTVTSILFVVAAFELYFIRPEILANRYAFTIPAIRAIGTPDYPIYLPDMFLILTSSFWSPALTWALTSVVLPSLFGYFFNLTATSHSGPRTRSKAALNDTVVDPLTFSIVKALISYVVYGQGVTFGGFLSETSIERLNGAVYGGYKGILVGTAVTGIVSIYEAVLRK
ncbi:hypothetical protein J3459_003829 [Metarhizium acridum]|uniref:Cupin-type protein n=1 Tax=Metarhizium acridum (strain CQMa 102) TaxID=655827 RepID=E9ECZ5_METAQ|nr:uncharacterized protein MAC_07743 [Metarhizium acridum CQMa 102]EFY86220.1 hypothetical protein MAC_07743 [Metarhizium acridum CQMa 102]KAG8420838.1 hypothetical protein J3458_002763 [Metarhizium acridum]KAG8428439.1 hypothetical protein J3459_003914 [Metarhizium acridum]KAG8428552.1 hypothetical protein J3459_003829 [Metarhizium acridum]